MKQAPLTGGAAADYAPRRVRAADCVLLVLVLAAALARPLSAPPIATHGEAREGLVVQDIVRNDEWVLPLRNGELPSKPPFFHWIAAGAAELFGLSDTTVRLPSALAAAVVAVATFACGVLAGGRLVGWLAVGALFGMHGFWESASEARVDMVLTACVVVALVAFAHWYRASLPERGASPHATPARAARRLCYLAAACGVLAKGPVGALLPALVIVAFLVGERRPAALAALWSWRLAALAGALAGGWYLLAFAEGGPGFLALQLGHENLDRLLGRGVFGAHGGDSRLALVDDLVTDLLPWSLVVPWAAYAWLRGAREDALGRFLHVWWLGILLVFSLAYGKRGVYLLPLHPAIALLAARALAAAVADAGAAVRVVARLPLLGRLRRWTPARPALAPLVVAIVVFDLALVTAAQLVREQRVRAKSLLPFTAAVEARVDPGTGLAADRDLFETDLQVLAYRLERPLARGEPPAEPSCDTPLYLVPADEAAGLVRGPWDALAVSDRPGADVALVGPRRFARCVPPSRRIAPASRGAHVDTSRAAP